MKKVFKKKLNRVSQYCALFLFLFSIILPSSASAANTLYLLKGKGIDIVPGVYYPLIVGTQPSRGKIKITLTPNQSFVTVSKTGSDLDVREPWCITEDTGSCKIYIITKNTEPFNIALSAPNYTAPESPYPFAPKYTKSLSISANPTSVLPGESTTMTVTTSDKAGDVRINFKLNELGQFCITDKTTGACGLTRKPIEFPYTVEVAADGYSSASVTLTKAQPLPDGSATTKNTDTNYEPLAPLPGLDKIIDTSATCAFGKYLDTMINIIIGISAVLAIIMIVLGGMEYMTSELISSKEHGKERITNAILGLLIALGAYALLNTINPDLLNKCLDTLPKAALAISQELPPTASDYANQGPIPSGAIGSCAEGITNPPISTSGGSFTVCNKIASSLQEMISKAKSDGYNLSGWGWRSLKRQEELRAENCGGAANVYNQSVKCSPLTAYPGTSMHEMGLAVDLTCSGESIQSKDNRCFLWLEKNAATYGFYNLRTQPGNEEPWHWSTNGK